MWATKIHDQHQGFIVLFLLCFASLVGKPYLLLGGAKTSLLEILQRFIILDYQLQLCISIVNEKVVPAEGGSCNLSPGFKLQFTMQNYCGQIQVVWYGHNCGHNCKTRFISTAILNPGLNALQFNNALLLIYTYIGMNAYSTEKKNKQIRCIIVLEAKKVN